MAAYLPLLKRLGEALVYGLMLGVGTYQAGHDPNAALVAGFGAAVGKFLPSHTVTSA
jgi:hypothetical protein